MDDVTYLHKYGQIQEYVAFADSSKRDKSAFVTPSEFAITWKTPFTLVTGIDIIDVSLPQSGYTINTTYNQVRFRFHSPGYEDNPDYEPPPWTTVAIMPGNYTPESLMAELREKLVEPIASLTTAPRRIDVRAASTPFDLVAKVVFVSEHPFELDTINSSMGAVLGFSQLIDVTDSNQIAGFTSRESLDLSSSETSLLSGSTATDKGYSLTKGKYMRQQFVATASSNISDFEVMIVPFGITSGLDGVVNLRVINARTNVQVVSGKIVVAFPLPSKLDGSSIIVANRNRDMFMASDTYWIEVYDDNNLDPNNCYRVTFGPGDQSGTLFTVENGIVDVWYERTAMMAAHLKAVPFNYVMVPPGILNLASPVGYVMLRCPEIEKHMYSSRAFETTNMGLAVVNLARGYQEKYSLVAPKRSFHPIARLSRLTFRWEAPDGSLYDFLGVDNHITFVLRYYTVPQHGAQIYPSQNPHYRPDLLDWINHEELADGDSDDLDDGMADLAPAAPASALHHVV
jgi:hypothetical protein